MGRLKDAVMGVMDEFEEQGQEISFEEAGKILMARVAKNDKPVGTEMVLLHKGEKLQVRFEGRSENGYEMKFTLLTESKDLKAGAVLVMLPEEVKQA